MEENSVKIKHKKSRIEKFCVFALIISPLLSIYSTFVQGVSLADALLIVSFVFASPRILKKYKKKKYSNYLVLFLLFALISIMLNLLAGQFMLIVQILQRFSKSFFYLIIVLILMRDLYDYDCMVKYLNIFSKLSCYILFIQAIAYYIFGFRISGKIPFINYIDGLSSYSGSGYVGLVNGQTLFRPTSLFAEPSHFSQFMVIPLAIALFRYRKIDWKMAAITSVAIVLTTSGQGIFLVGFLWLVWIFKYIKENIKNIKKVINVLIVPLISSLILIIILNIPVVELALSRILSLNMGVYSGRIETGYNLFFSNNNFAKLVGVGFGNVELGLYMNSAAYILYTTGIIGSILVLLYFLDSYVMSNEETRVILVIMFILTFTSFYFFSITATVTMAFVQGKYKEKGKQSVKKLIKHSISV